MKNVHTTISFSGPGYITKAVHLLKGGYFTSSPKTQRARLIVCYTLEC